MQSLKAAKGIVGLKALLALSTFTNVWPAFAQIPQDIPHQSEPVDFSDPVNILLYGGAVLAMTVFYVLWRKSQGKKPDSE